MSLSAVSASPMPRANLRRADKSSILTTTIAAYRAAANVFCETSELADSAEDAVKKLMPPLPGVFCGMIEETTIIANGVTTVLPKRPCYFRSIAEIDNSRSLTEVERYEKSAEMLAQIAEATASVPPELRATAKKARRDASAASAAYDKIERTLASFKPTTAADAAELLEFAASPRLNSFSGDQFCGIMRNVAKALRNGGLR